MRKFGTDCQSGEDLGQGGTPLSSTELFARMRGKCMFSCKSIEYCWWLNALTWALGELKINGIDALRCIWSVNNSPISEDSDKN